MNFYAASGGDPRDLRVSTAFDFLVARVQHGERLTLRTATNELNRIAGILKSQDLIERDVRASITKHGNRLKIDWQPVSDHDAVIVNYLGELRIINNGTDNS